MSDAAPNPALKEIFNHERIVHIGKQLADVQEGFDQPGFVQRASAELAAKSIMQRLRHIAISLHDTLEMDFDLALPVLKRLAPRIGHGFASMILPEYVALFWQDPQQDLGQARRVRQSGDHFDTAMAALAFFTGFGSSEFAVRHFLLHDQARALAIMEGWSKHDDPHVRRLASEGSRPRLPWSFQLKALVADPSGTAAILENLRADDSLYVRKSVANHLNDISEDHPGLLLERLAGWDMDNRHSAWIVRHALRTLIKQGNGAALAQVGVHGAAAVTLDGFSVSPGTVTLGQRIVIEARLTSTSDQTQKIEVDYALHYARRSGQAARKVFKFRQLLLAPYAASTLAITQTIRDFSTRKHYPGHHTIELLVNGHCLATAGFDLVTEVTVG